MKTHEQYMSQALIEAQKALNTNEIPVGCVITNKNGDIIGRGYNKRESIRQATAHAEIEAIRCACTAINDWRLTDCSLYVTLEPCPMCAGAIIMARIKYLFFGAKDELTGSCGSVINLFMESYPQNTHITGEILADECSALLSGFFKDKRINEV